MPSNWSITDYCQEQVASALNQNAASLGASSRAFLKVLGLPKIHPFCQHGNVEDFFSIQGCPPMGPMDHRFSNGSFWWEELVTIWFMVAPPLLAMAELWIRLFAGLLGPLGCLYLIYLWMTGSRREAKSKTRSPSSNRSLQGLTLLTVGGSLVLMTDTYYVLNNGRLVGAAIFIVAVGLAVRTCLAYQLTTASMGVWMLVLLAIHLVWEPSTNILQFGSLQEEVHISEGLYYNTANSFVQSIVDHWPEHYRNYTQVATPWMPSGDSRTGLPFLLNHLPFPNWHRVFLPTLEEEDGEKEYVALDISFADGGVFDPSHPTYLVLHGLNGGSKEEYIRDFTFRRNAEGSTVVVMVARGLMDLPVRGWNIFHGARTSDAHAAALALRAALGEEAPLIGVGYSMGGIILNNYVASYGDACVLDGAIGLSGGLDMRFQEHFFRAQRLWQPILAETLRSDFLLGKFGKRAYERLSEEEWQRMMRATHITEIDRYAVVPYNGFHDLNDYYTSMSALGDIPMGADGLLERDNSNAKIHSVAIPLVAVQAFDDPLITWRASAQNSGFMYPENLVQSGSGKLMLLLTKSGGHVGWPTGMLPFVDKWMWMSNVVGSFGQAVTAAKRIRQQ